MATRKKAASVEESVEAPKTTRTRKTAAKPAAEKPAAKKAVVKKAPAKKPVKQPMPVYEIIDTDYENPWYYKGEIFNSTSIKEAHGMIYLIEEISTGRLYIGQKQLWTKKPRMVNKKKKMIKAESDWKKYYSSSNYIMEKVEKEGWSDFKRSILVLCISDGQMNYVEMKLQMDLRMMEHSDLYINGYIGGRISTSHAKFDQILDADYDLLNKLYSKSYFGFKP